MKTRALQEVMGLALRAGEPCHACPSPPDMTLAMLFSEEDGRFVLYDTDSIAARDELVKGILAWLERHLRLVIKECSG